MEVKACSRTHLVLSPLAPAGLHCGRHNHLALLGLRRPALERGLQELQHRRKGLRKRKRA